jgi:hypothetical protein
MLVELHTIDISILRDHSPSMNYSQKFILNGKSKTNKGTLNEFKLDRVRRIYTRVYC